MERQRTYRTVAAGLLVLAGIVLTVTPYLVDAPNPIGLVLGIVSVLIGLGVRAGRLRTVAFVWSAVGLGASLLWAAFALDGFGQGTPWLDDVVEAVALAAIYGGTLITLVFASRATP